MTIIWEQVNLAPFLAHLASSFSQACGCQGQRWSPVVGLTSVQRLLTLIWDEKACWLELSEQEMNKSRPQLTICRQSGLLTTTAHRSSSSIGLKRGGHFLSLSLSCSRLSSNNKPNQLDISLLSLQKQLWESLPPPPTARPPQPSHQSVINLRRIRAEPSWAESGWLARKTCWSGFYSHFDCLARQTCSDCGLGGLFSK